MADMSLPRIVGSIDIACDTPGASTKIKAYELLNATTDDN